METMTVKATCTEEGSVLGKDRIDPGVTLAFMVTRDKQPHFAVPRKGKGRSGAEGEHCRQEVPSQVTENLKNAGGKSAVWVARPPGWL